MDIRLDESEKENFELIEINFVKHSYEQSIAKRLDIKADFHKLTNDSYSESASKINKLYQNRYKLSVDSSSFSLDNDFNSILIASADAVSLSKSDSIDTGLSCSLEVKYTNTEFRAISTCLVNRIKFKIKFKQIFHIESIELKEFE